MRPAAVPTAANAPADPTAADELRIQQVTAKITYLNSQIDSLEAYLPETYQYLMDQLDQQRVLLEGLNLKLTFRSIDQQQSF